MNNSMINLSRMMLVTLLLGAVSVVASATPLENCSNSEKRMVFIEEVSCADDGCFAKMLDLDDVIASSVDDDLESLYIEAQCGDASQCEALVDQKVSLLAEVKLKAEFWDSANSDICRIKELKVIKGAP